MPRTSGLRRKLVGTALSAAAAGALVLGLAAPASAYTDPAVNSCLNFTHNVPWHSMKQTVTGTNTCSSGTYSFMVHTWVNTGHIFGDYVDDSECFSLSPGQSNGYRWPRGRKYQIQSC